jgi:CheY-like chemotaxis protein
MVTDLLFDMQPDGLDIYPFENGESALDFIKQEGADLIFTAIETEGIDGVTFVDLILREKPKLVSKLFVMTSQVDSEHFNDIKGVGAKRFFKKPINAEHFNHFVVPEVKKVLAGIV